MVDETDEGFPLDPDVIPGVQVETAEYSLPPEGVAVQEQLQAADKSKSSVLQKLIRYVVRTVFNAQYNQVRFDTNSTTEITLFEAAANRQYLIIQNRSTDSIFIVFGQKADSNLGILLAAGGSYEPTIPPVNSIHIIGDQIAGSQVVIGIQGLV